MNLRFSHYLIDLAARELRDDGRLLQLSPKIFDCIAYLIENRGRAVGRDELMAAVWGRADTADTQLGQAMLKARRVLGDSGEAQHTIRTIAGFGYRWVADVHDTDGIAEDACAPFVSETASTVPLALTPEAAHAETASAVPPVARASPNDGGHHASQRWFALAVAVSLVMSLALAAWAWHRQHDAAPRSAGTIAIVPPKSVEAIAVLPAVLDADAESAWLRLGLMEFVAARLRGAGLTVAPSENVVSAMRAATDPAGLPDAVRRALDPRWLVAPAVRKTDGGWTVNIELRDRDGKPRVVSANAGDAVAAARMASDRLLDLLGRRNIGTETNAAGWPFEELLSRVDAALLVDDLDGARRLLQAAPPEQRDASDARLRQAEIESSAGRFEVARADLERLLAEVPAETDPLRRARIVSARGAVLIRLGRTEDADRALGDALDLLEGRGEPALLGKTHMRRGVARSLLGRHDVAMADFAQARIAMQLAGDTLGTAQVELNEGALNGTRNHPADALESFRRAERQFERFGISGELANALANQIVAHRVLLQPAEALAVSKRSLALFGKLPNAEAEHLLKLRRAQALADVGRSSEAGMLLDELARALDPAHETELAAMTATERAQLDLARGQAESTLALTAPIVERLTEPAFASTRAEAWFITIRALHALGRDAEAADAVHRFSTWSSQAGNSTFLIHARLAEAEQAVTERRFTDADRLYADSLRAADAQNVPADIADVAMSYGSSLIARGELARAAPVVGRVARFADNAFGCALLQIHLYRALGQGEALRSAFAHARSLAGERTVPAELAVLPAAANIGNAAAEPGPGH